MTRNDSYSTSLRARLLGMTALTGLVAATTAFPIGDANAAGFALKEQSGSAQGNSFAGATAGAEDVTYMFFNPAGLTRQEGHQASVVLSYIAPSAKTNDADGLVGGSAVQDGGVSALVPAAYFMWSLSPDLKLAMGINAPFGLKTE
ncbi:MAG: outer membrane protein transport protein, partial [Alphaproteobacteria bacterium]|nr:outer membrane protein transport protein [Alphaproteobacteria bacterium]